MAIKTSSYWPEKVDEIIGNVDYQGNGQINYTEFLAATMEVRKFLDDNKVLAIFNQFDTEAKG